MKIHIIVGGLVVAGGLIGAGLCVMAAAAETEAVQLPVVVVSAQSAVTVDGKLDEADWKRVPVHALTLLDSSVNLPDLPRNQILADPYEGGSAQFLLGDKFLYVGMELEDHDVVAQINKDQTFLFNSGDVVEVFIKADNAHGYFELYASPLGNKTSFFFPSSGYLGLPACTSGPQMEGLVVAANVQGTVNDFHDVDKGWTAEIAIPLSALKDNMGIDFSPGQSWRMLVSRYNYGYSMRAKQFSSYPKLPQVNYHLFEYYAPVRLPLKALEE